MMMKGTVVSAAIRKAALIKGRCLRFRDAQVGDAEFIHGLRTDAVRAQFLSAVPPGVEHQIDWLRRYARDGSQAYFVIQAIDADERLGTVRLYGARGRAFSWGSWLLKEGLPGHWAIESALMTYHYGVSLGFNSAYFEVHHQNVSVWRFHERFGAVRVARRGEQYAYELSPRALSAGLEKYRRYLPDGIRVSQA